MLASSVLLATLSDQSLPQWQSLAFFATLVLWWAMMRPAMVRDYDNRRLPSNPTARIIFIFLCVLVYIGLVVAFHASRDIAINLMKGLPFVANLVDNFKDQAPLLAAVTLGGLLQLSFFRDIERSVLVWLHSARHLHSDGQTLAAHLARAAFQPSEDENLKNRETAKKYGVYIVDDGSDGVSLVTFSTWRKVATLLRLLREWNTEERRTLEQADMNLLAEIETAHERKTQLAMTIVKMIEQVGKGRTTAHALSELMGVLSSASHLDRSSVAEIEARMKAMLAGQTDTAVGQPLRLTAEELRGHLAQIEGYFQVEYDILLQQAGDLAAKSVILSGDQAPERLEQLKHVGFGGLGRIEPINFDRILWLFVVVTFGGFLILFLGNIGNAAAPPNWERTARFSLIMALCALIGAVVGSHRRHARATSTPWGAYFVAGLIAAIVYVAVHSAAELIKSYLAAEGTKLEQRPLSLTLPWVCLPFMLTVAICRLARLDHWPGLSRLGDMRHIPERIVDGIVASGAVLVGFYAAVALHIVFELELPKSLQAKMELPHILPIPVFVPLQLLGFFIGFFVVRDVRRAAHAKIVDPRAQATAAPRPSVATVQKSAPQPA